MNDFAQQMAEDQRLVILQILLGQNDYTAHEHMLKAALVQAAHRLSSDVVRSHLAWLDEQGLVNMAGEQTKIAVLTQRGEDTARGYARVLGVARPRP